LSVSRVGGAAQPASTRSVAGRLRLDLAQFRELAAFSQFSSDLDAETQARLARGRLLTEILKQPQYSPLSVWQQVVIIMAATEGALDGVDAEKIGLAKDALLAATEKKDKKLTEKLDKGEKPDDKDKKVIVDIATQIAKEYKKVDK
jgi:F-type H+-transporting ATPase subunit alpha